ncbi:MAG TPA: endonuclease/exonuclease/phosphatase family protein [Phycisphaerales bacterium]|nr:endonuclease/exonuclease/phosphatase family protein [Phycisphaerales bacterium]
MKNQLKRMLAGVAALSVGASALLLTACAGSNRPAVRPVTRITTPGDAGILLDGDTADWPSDVVITADPNYLYLRFSPGQAYTLQAANVTTSILLDVDADKGTGEGSSLAPFDQMGVDLELEFSPRQGAAIKNGVYAHTVDSQGRRTPIQIQDLDLTCTPTYAATWYELRISRTPENAGLLPRGGLLSSGRVTGVFATRDGNGKVTGYSDPFSADVGPASAGTVLGRADLPGKPAGAVRVMAYNVEKSGPLSQPEVFRRVFAAVRPDVVLISEWEQGDAESVQGWFAAMVGEGSWNVVKAPGDNASGGGVAVVSRWPLTPLLKNSVTRPGSDGNGTRPVRFIGATIVTPMGDVVAAATHLKCCGTMDSSEDRTRLAEAKAINAAVGAALAELPATTLRVIGGDFNLVGSRPPLDLLRAGLDSDGSDLSVAMPVVLGDRTVTTWRDPKSGFGPGRLDYLLFSDANAEVANAFVLDTWRLSDESLARIGLDRTDTEVSDHLPVIVDLMPRR